MLKHERKRSLKQREQPFCLNRSMAVPPAPRLLEPLGVA